MSEYIKKEDVLVEIDNAEGYPCGSPIKAYEIAKTIIRELPSADVVEREKYELDKAYAFSMGIEASRKRGEWINVRQEGVCSWTGECSCCHKRNDIPPPILAHFCPNCGARMMRGESDDK